MDRHVWWIIIWSVSVNWTSIDRPTMFSCRICGDTQWLLIIDSISIQVFDVQMCQVGSTNITATEEYGNYLTLDPGTHI